MPGGRYLIHFLNGAVGVAQYRRPLQLKRNDDWRLWTTIYINSANDWFKSLKTLISLLSRRPNDEVTVRAGDIDREGLAPGRIFLNVELNLLTIS